MHLLALTDLRLLLIVLLMCPAALAEDVEIDIENAPTPTNLLELLPEGGIDAVDIEAWVVMKATHNKMPIPSMDRYSHWSIKPVDGQLVVQLRQCYPEPRRSLTVQRYTYTSKGDLVAYHEIRKSRGVLTADMIGKVEGDELVIKPNPKADGLNASLSRERRVPMKTFETHLPIALTPLIRAYHIRMDHLGYHFATVDLTRNAEKIARTAEDVGTETLQIDGQEVVGHLLMETSQREAQRKGSSRALATQSQTMVLKDGGTISSTAKQSKYIYTTKRVPEKEARERFEAAE